MSLTATAEQEQCSFIVRNVDEALQRIRDRFGDQGEVISVRQVKPGGLRGLVASPQLEIVARRKRPAPGSLPPPAEQPPVFHDSPAPAASSSEPPTPEPTASELKPATTESAPEEPRPMPLPTAQVKNLSRGRNCRVLLKEAGFEEELLARLECSREWRQIEEMSPERGLPLAASFLRQYGSLARPQAIPRVLAFLGGAGAGKTTAICKLVARDVFVDQVKPQVVRLEVDKPHLDSGLKLYAEVFGLEYLDTFEDVDPHGRQPVYVDIPGFGLHSPGEQQRVAEALDEYGIRGRVLVQNAAYQESIRKKITELGRRLRVTHQVFTHLDELVYFGSLWPAILNPECPVLFFSTGANVAADRIDNCFDYLLGKTFPL